HLILPTLSLGFGLASRAVQPGRGEGLSHLIRHAKGPIGCVKLTDFHAVKRVLALLRGWGTATCNSPGWRAATRLSDTAGADGRSARTPPPRRAPPAPKSSESPAIRPGSAALPWSSHSSHRSASPASTPAPSR